MYSELSTKYCYYIAVRYIEGIANASICGRWATCKSKAGSTERVLAKIPYTCMYITIFCTSSVEHALV